MNGSSFIVHPSSFFGSGARGREVATHTVTFITPDRQLTLEVPEDQYLLEAGVEASLDLPYMCLQGWCTTCAARLLEGGKVDQSEARRYYAQDAEAGFILPCSAYPR